MVELDSGNLKVPLSLGIAALFIWILWRRMRKVDKREFAQSLKDRVAVITGGSEGLGFQVAKELVSRGCKVYLVSRHVTKLQRAVNKLCCENNLSEGSERVCYYQVDTSDFNSIKAFADFFNKREEKLDFLINNAGVITSKRLLSQQGIDLVMATHYFGHFLLTELLLGELEESLFGGVVVNITSDMSSYMGSLDVIQPNKEFKRHPWDKFNQYYLNESYATAKVALEMHSQYMASASIASCSNVRFFSANPGLLDTNISDNWPKWMSRYLKPLMKLTAMKHVSEGVHVVLNCLLSSEVVSGCTYKGLSVLKSENHYPELDCQLLYKSSKEIVSFWNH